MKENNQFSHKFVWDDNGVGRIVIKLNDSSDDKNTIPTEKNNKK